MLQKSRNIQIQLVIRFEKFGYLPFFNVSSLNFKALFRIYLFCHCLTDNFWKPLKPFIHIQCNRLWIYKKKEINTRLTSNEGHYWARGLLGVVYLFLYPAIFVALIWAYVRSTGYIQRNLNKSTQNQIVFLYQIWLTMHRLIWNSKRTSVCCSKSIGAW